MGLFSGVLDSIGLGDGNTPLASALGLPGAGEGISSLTGQTAAEASLVGAQLQADSAREALEQEIAQRGIAQEFLSPYAGVGLDAVNQSSFLTDPQQQFDYLQSNPLFQLGLDNANAATLAGAAAGGRLASGDTLEQLSNNVLLTAQPLINQQASNIAGLMDFGLGTAQTQGNIAIGQGTNVGNLLTDIGSAQSAGQIGAANATTAGAQNIVSALPTIMQAFSAFSDPKLKENIKKIGERGGFNWYRWDWNELAKTIGLSGSSSGVMADEVKAVRPDLVTEEDGFMKVNYAGVI